MCRRRFLVESKSLKLYLNSFRNHGAFHEDCTVAIGKKIVALLKPKYLRIGGYWYPRGGMPIDVFWQSGKLPKDVWMPPDQGVAPYQGPRLDVRFHLRWPSQPMRADQADRDQHRRANPQHRVQADGGEAGAIDDRARSPARKRRKTNAAPWPSRARTAPARWRRSAPQRADNKSRNRAARNS